MVERGSVGDPVELRSDADHIAAHKGGSVVVEGFLDGRHEAVSKRRCAARSLHLEVSRICGCPSLSSLKSGSLRERRGGSPCMGSKVLSH